MDLRPVPASEAVLCRFVAFLGREGLKHRTIKSYLSAVRHLHIAEGVPDPFQLSRHRLEYVLRGVKRCKSEKGSEGRERLPISPDILRRIKTSWESVLLTTDIVMLRAACCLAFFGFLRSWELSVPSDATHDPKVHLNVSDIAVNNPASPTVIRVSIKQSKTDPFRRGVDLFMGKTGTDLCPVKAILQYLVVRGTQRGLVPLPGRPPAYTSEICRRGAESFTAGRHRSVQVLRPQFSDWCCHHGSSKGQGGLSHQDARQVEEPSLSRQCEDSKRGIGPVLLSVCSLIVRYCLPSRRHAW